MAGHCQKPLCSPRPLERVENHPGWCFWVLWRESAVFLEKSITWQDNQPSHALPRKRCFHQVLLMPPLCWLTVRAPSRSLVVLAATPALAFLTVPKWQQRRCYYIYQSRSGCGLCELHQTTFCCTVASSLPFPLSAWALIPAAEASITESLLPGMPTRSSAESCSGTSSEILFHTLHGWHMSQPLAALRIWKCGQGRWSLLLLKAQRACLTMGLVHLCGLHFPVCVRSPGSPPPQHHSALSPRKCDLISPALGKEASHQPDLQQAVRTWIRKQLQLLRSQGQFEKLFGRFSCCCAGSSCFP